MPYYRLDELARHHLNPHLSTGKGPLIEGRYMYFRMNIKAAGTGSKLHYHPNELMAFPVRGKINCVVGKERRIVPPGVFVHVPPCARHAFQATEDDDVHYLYIKDRTWTLIGAAADEALPDQAPSATQVAKALEEGRWPGQDKAPEKSQAIIEGLGNCYYPMLDSLDAPAASGHHEQWVEGVNLAFGIIESPPGTERASRESAHECFAYVLRGALDAQVDGESRHVIEGDVIQVPRGGAFTWRVADGANARYALVRSTSRLEEEIERNGAADNWRG